MLYLDERQSKILLLIVEYYIQKAEPISSRILAKTVDIELSAATIRNIMADLTEMGYIYQPHTSAGRIPTEKGYRCFVDQVITQEKLTNSDEEVLLNFRYQDVPGKLEDILRTTTKLLASLTNLAGFVSSPKLSISRMKLVDFLRLNEQQILIVLVTQTGMVSNKIVNVHKDLSQDFLNSLGYYLNKIFYNQILTRVRSKLVEALDHEKTKYNNLFPQAVRLGKKAFEITDSGELYLYGQTNMFSCPEFSAPERLKSVYDAFENKTQILNALSGTVNSTDVDIYIGTENQCSSLDECSIVAASYGTTKNSLGTIGVIGPTRMEYDRNISIIRHMAKILSQEVSRFIE